MGVGVVLGVDIVIGVAVSGIVVGVNIVLGVVLLAALFWAWC